MQSWVTKSNLLRSQRSARVSFTDLLLPITDESGIESERQKG